MRVAFCAAEVFPFAKTGGLADVSGALPLALEKEGVEVVIFLPRYQEIHHEHFEMEKIGPHLAKSKYGQNIDVYFIEHDHYFDRSGLYGDHKGDYQDNLDRFQFFCDQVFKSLKKLKLKVDVLHCHDWHTALIPVYLKEKYKKDAFFAKTKSLLTIHNLAFQGVFPKSEYSKLGLKKSLFGMDGFEYYDQINLLKAGIIYSDEVSTVSKRYAKEIQTPEYGCGLEGVLKHDRKKLTGILNGIDYGYWDPKTDPAIAQNYDAKDFAEGKAANKKALQKKMKFPAKADTPMLGFVSRLAYQKGVDLIAEAMPELAKLDVQIMIQGVGGSEYMDKLTKLSKKYSKKLKVCFDFDEGLAHLIYAGSDMFLMPSLFEPCGLSQMISMRFGTVPIVFETGGLAETVKTGENGFVFKKYSKEDFVKTLTTAVKSYKSKRGFQKLIKNGLKADFGWKKSARNYKKLYQCL